MNIFKYLGIDKPADKKIVILFQHDESCDMGQVQVNGDVVYAGNYSDFHNGCHGDYELEEFNNSDEYIDVLKSAFKKAGYEVAVEYGEYIYVD